MTASLPVPNDIDPEEPDRHPGARVVPMPAPEPQSSKEPRPPRKPRAPRKPKANRMSSGDRTSSGERTIAAAQRPPAPAFDPGPPPPLPDDLKIVANAAADIVVPPKPPLPAEAAAKADAQSAITGSAPATVDSSTTIVEPDAEQPQTAALGVEDAEAPADAAPATIEPAPPTIEPAPLTVEPAPPAVEPDPNPDAEPDAEAVPTPAPAAEEVAAELPAEDAPRIPAPAPSPAEAEDALVLRGVSKRFGGTHAVDGIDLTVPAGTFYGLVGPNGAGKTTTLSMIAGLLEPDRGSIRVGGIDASAKPLAAKKMMGVLPDRLRTFDRLTGRQLLYYYGVLRGLPAAVVESRTADLARAFDLEDALGRSVSDYSAGMLKKVMLAGALIHSPRLLVLDEPFEAVDPVSSAIILDILSTYVAHGGTVILSSHTMELVERVCSRVAVIVAGQVLAEGTVDEVRGELTLEQRFVELAGGLSDVEGLEWLHTFSG